MKKGEIRGKIKAKVRPKMGRGTGGFIVTSVKLKVEEGKKQKGQNNG